MTSRRQWPKRLPSKRVNYRYTRDSAKEFGRPLRPFLRQARTQDEREAWAIEQMHLDQAFDLQCVYGCQCGWCFDADRDYPRETCEACWEGLGIVPCPEHDAMVIFDERFAEWRRPLAVALGERLRGA